MRVEDFLRSSAKRAPGKVALVAGKTRSTFKDLDLASDRLATTLAARGVERGDRVVTDGGRTRGSRSAARIGRTVPTVGRVLGRLYAPLVGRLHAALQGQ